MKSLQVSFVKLESHKVLQPIFFAFALLVDIKALLFYDVS